MALISSLSPPFSALLARRTRKIDCELEEPNCFSRRRPTRVSVGGNLPQLLSYMRPTFRFENVDCGKQSSSVILTRLCYVNRVAINITTQETLYSTMWAEIFLHTRSMVYKGHLYKRHS